MENTTPSRLVGLRALRRYLENIVGKLSPADLRALAESGEIPCVRLKGTRGRNVFGFDCEAVEAVLLERARAGKVVSK
jgi:hypothetical protein